MSSSSALPPLGNLPSWSRVSTLDRSRYPKPFLRDRLQTLPPPPHGELGERQLDIPLQVIDSMPGDQHSSNRIVYYNKSIQFLQQQHAETLMKLHEEIEDLKRANKDLQFKIIMRKSSSRGVREASEIQDVIGQEEIKDLRQRLKDAQARNVKLTHALRKFSKRPSDEGAGGSPPTSEGSATGDEAGGSTPGNNADVDNISRRRRHSRDVTPPADAVILPLGAILNPLRIKQTRDEAEDEYCEPSFRECEIIINHLYNLSVHQSEENGFLRADLAHAKKASRRGSTKTNRSDDVTHFPRVSLNEAASAKRNSAASSQATAERVNLPALKQTLNTNVAERRKRMQAVKSNKSRKKHSFDQF